MRSELAARNKRLNKFGDSELPTGFLAQKDPQAVIYIPPIHSVNLFLCEPLLTTASHKAYRTVLVYQVSANGWIGEQHQATAAITIKLEGHMLDARQWYATISHLRAFIPRA